MQLARGDKNKMYKYLNQFRTLIPERIAALKKSLQAEDRTLIRQILHKMSPQLQFFGVPNVVQPIKKLEETYQTMSMKALKQLVQKILITLQKAWEEVVRILEAEF